jgi:hypothetical protein
MEIVSVSSSESVMTPASPPWAVQVAAPRPASDIVVVESPKKHAPATEAPAMDAIPAVGGSLKSGGSAEKAMEAAAPARAEQEYPLAIVVSGKVLIVEETVTKASTGSRARTHVLALEELQREEA